MNVFNRDMKAWGKKMAEDESRMSLFGFMDISGQETSLYESAAGAA